MKKTKPVSRQMRYNLRRISKGLCPVGGCTRKRDGYYCKFHKAKNRERMSK